MNYRDVTVVVTLHNVPDIFTDEDVVRQLHGEYVISDVMDCNMRLYDWEGDKEYVVTASEILQSNE